MNNYESASDFELLAIKILEKYLNTKFDTKRTRKTQETRDFGVDAFVYIENEFFSDVRTIEAKLRSYKYTLALKDIATSIIFFILRHGNEHYIISNVFLTNGTIDAINSINDNNKGQIYYIDGEKTKAILETILPELKEDELELAERIIKEFPKLKKPQIISINKKQSNSLNNILYESRKKYLTEVLEELNTKKWVSISGDLGVGKHLIVKKVINSYEKECNIINIDIMSNGIISDFCYELSDKLFNISVSISDLVDIVKNDDRLLCSWLNESEQSNLKILYEIFNNNSVSEDSSIYLAKKYLVNLFKSFKKNYLIVIDNFNSANAELFNLISQLSAENDTNFKFLVITTTNSEFYTNFFDYKFKKLYYKIFSEVNMKEFDLDESIIHISEINNLLKPDTATLIYKYIGGNPKLIEQFVKEKANNFIVSNYFTGFTDLNTYYKYQAKVDIIDIDFLHALFLIYILGELDYNDINKYFDDCKISKIENYFSTSPFFAHENNKALFNSNYIKDIIEIELLDCKNLIEKLPIKNIRKIYNLDSLNQIIYNYYFNDYKSMIDLYNTTKNYWNHKDNLEWNIKALKYICLFLKNNINVNNEISIIEFSEASVLLYKVCKDTPTLHFSAIFKTLDIQIKILEENYSSFDKKHSIRIACILFDYYIQKFYALNKLNSNKFLLCMENKIWFFYIDEYRKILFIRLKALSYKSLGEKSEFHKYIKKLKTYNTPYSQFSYYANLAAQYYTTDPIKAYNLLSKCPFGDYDDIDLKAIDLWIENDMAIILFYLNKLYCSKKCANLVLQKSLKLSYDENIARSYNILAIIELKNGNYKLAKNYFYSSITYSINCKNDSILHFATNYLNVSYNKEVEDICYDFFKTNIERLYNIFNDSNSSKRLLISLISFLKILKKNDEVRYNDLYYTFSTFINEYKNEKIECKIDNKTYVLF